MRAARAKARARRSRVAVAVGALECEWVWEQARARADARGGEAGQSKRKWRSASEEKETGGPGSCLAFVISSLLGLTNDRQLFLGLRISTAAAAKVTATVDPLFVSC